MLGLDLTKIVHVLVLILRSCSRAMLVKRNRLAFSTTLILIWRDPQPAGKYEMIN